MAGINCLAVSNNGSQVASGDTRRVVNAWSSDTKAQTLDHGEHKEKILALAWTPDDTGLATISFDYSLVVYNLATNKHY